MDLKGQIFGMKIQFFFFKFCLACGEIDEP